MATAVFVAIVLTQLAPVHQVARAQTDAPPESTPTPAVIAWAFTRHGDRPDVMLAEGINAAASRVDAALYGLSRALDVDALLEKHQACGCVRLISDATQSGGFSQKAALQRLQSAGVPIKVDRHAGLMHMKVVAIDQAVLYEGSFNPTDPASTVNDEVLFRLDSPEAATAFGEEFDTMWNDAQHYRDWTPSIVPTPKPAE